MGCCSSICGLYVLPASSGEVLSWARVLGRKSQSVQEADNSLSSSECWTLTCTRAHRRFMNSSGTTEQWFQVCSSEQAATTNINPPGNVSSFFNRLLARTHNYSKRLRFYFIFYPKCQLLCQWWTPKIKCILLTSVHCRCPSAPSIIRSE